MKLFTEIQVLEVEKGTRLEPMTTELKESLKTLQHNPAFNYLLNRLKLQKAQVQHFLNEGYDKTEKELRFAQAGIFWLRWLEDETNKLTRNAVPSARTALDQELEEFNKIGANLQVIGSN